MRANNRRLQQEGDTLTKKEGIREINTDASERYRFSLLREEAVDADAFEDKTHDKIAETLCKLIGTERGGVTVGLEGTWGSGKSAVISILRKKLEKRDDIRIFTFDAWAHEGDPLRRIFLESLIEDLFTKKTDDVKNLQSKISKRLSIHKISSSKSATGLGKFLAVATLFVPFGICLFRSVDLQNLTFGLAREPYWLFLMSIVFVLAPIWVLFARLLILLVKAIHKSIPLKEIIAPKNWTFMQGESTEDTTREVSEDDERSSIEFEYYFKQIMTSWFSNAPEKKLVLVIDNLDRVDPNDSLKIWSTLQTFLQQRSAPANTQSWFDKIWIIVPYDPDGLAEIWNQGKEIGNEEDRGATNTTTGKAQFFFDKCFQLKCEVPKPIITAWENFARDRMQEAFPKWTDHEREDVLDILTLTRENLNDIPTPRQIKNYINQVGLMRMHSHPTIPTISIAYYVIQRILKGESVDNVRKQSIAGTLPEPRYRQFLPDSCGRDMAGLVFGVSPDKGQQLLLEPDIAKALTSGNGEKLRKIQEKHSDGFWAVFHHHIRKRSYVFEDLLTYSGALYDAFWKDYRSELVGFTKKAREAISKSEKLKWPSENTIKSYACLSKIIDNPETCRFLYMRLIGSLNSEILSEEPGHSFDITTALNILRSLVEIFDINTQETLSALTYGKFVPWAQASLQSNIPAWRWIVPDKPLAGEISSKIGRGTAIPPGPKDVFNYLVKAEAREKWEELVAACQNHIQHNNGILSGNSHSPDVFEILFTLAFGFHEYDARIEGIVKDWRFYTLAWHFYKRIMPILALLCGKCIRNKLNQYFPTQGSAPQFAQVLRQFWNNRNEANAKTLFGLLKDYNEWHFLWELLDDSNNKLLVDIILLALKDEKAATLFETENGLQKIKSYFSLLCDEESNSTDLFVKALIVHSPLEKEIIEKAELDIVEYSRELCSVATHSNNDDLLRVLAGKLKLQTQEMWRHEIEGDSYLSRLAIKIQEKVLNFGLENHYADALFDFMKTNSDDIDGISEWQRKNWNKLVSLMINEFQQQFEYDWTNFLMADHRTVCDEIIDLNKTYCNHEKIRENVETVQDILRDAIHNRNFLRLKWLNESVLSRSKGKKFKPEAHFPKTVEEPLNTLVKAEQEQGKLENVKVLKELASKFQVKLATVGLEDQSDDKSEQ